MSSTSSAAGSGLRLEHEFRHPELLVRALTHSSYANENDTGAELPSNADNEQLEFLGDAVLSLVTSEHLCKRFPSYSEGELSKVRAHLVSSRHLAKVARNAQLGRHILLGRGEERTGGRTKQAILADAVEAIIAAIYLDGGIAPARAYILQNIVEPELERMGQDPAAKTAGTDFKSTLQEALQADGRAQPVYEVIAQAGPEHNKVFTVAVKLDDEFKIRAEGRSKKAAEQKAAELALRHLRVDSSAAK